MTCTQCLYRPARLSGRSPICIVCHRGAKHPRLRKRKLNAHEQEQQRRLLVRRRA